MSSFRSDPLLGVARALLVFFMAVFIVAAAACVIAIPVVLFTQGEIIAEIAKEAPKAANAQFVWALAGLLAAVTALVAAMWFFTLKLKQIVDSVAAGDPFIPENAERLKVMAWMSIALQLIAVPVGLFAAWVSDKVEPTDVDLSISGNGLLLALVLFILARVFRTGAQMREDLEGTV